MPLLRLTHLILLSCALAFAGLHGPAFAQYTGPGATPLRSSVAEILKNPVEDQEVLLRGKLLKKLTRDKFLFSDGTGEIRVDIDDNVFGNLKVSENTVVEIYGEIEKDFLRDAEIDVKRISVITP